MNACFPIPGLGQTCLSELSFRIGSREVNVTDPSFLAIVVIAVVLVIFIFKSPVGRGR